MRWTLQELFGGRIDPTFTYECTICGTIVGDLNTHLNWHNDAIKDWQISKPLPKDNTNG